MTTSTVELNDNSSEVSENWEDLHCGTEAEVKEQLSRDMQTIDSSVQARYEKDIEAIRTEVRNLRNSVQLLEAGQHRKRDRRQWKARDVKAMAETAESEEREAKALADENKKLKEEVYALQLTFIPAEGSIERNPSVRVARHHEPHAHKLCNFVAQYQRLVITRIFTQGLIGSADGFPMDFHGLHAFVYRNTHMPTRTVAAKLFASIVQQIGESYFAYRKAYEQHIQAIAWVFLYYGEYVMDLEPVPPEAEFLDGLLDKIPAEYVTPFSEMIFIYHSLLNNNLDELKAKGMAPLTFLSEVISFLQRWKEGEKQGL